MSPTLASCREIPQTTSTEWLVDRRRDPDSEWLWLWLVPARDGEFRGFTVGEPAEDAFQDLLSTVFDAPQEGEAERPGRVVTTDAAAVEPLRAVLSPLGVEVVHREPTPAETEYLDELRPTILQQLMLGASLPEADDIDQFERLLDALEHLAAADPWRRLPRHSCFMVEGFSEQPLAVLLGMEGELRTLGVLTLDDVDKRNAPDDKKFEREGLWLQFDQNTVMGHDRLWASMGRGDEGPLEDEDQVNQILAGIEVVVKSLGQGRRPPEEQSFTLEDWVDRPCTIGVLFLGEEPAAHARPQQQPHGNRKSSRRRKR